MTLQTSGAISLQDLEDEYGGEHPIGIDEFYGNIGIPQSGVVSLGDFYGKSRNSMILAQKGFLSSDSTPANVTIDIPSLIPSIEYMDPANTRIVVTMAYFILGNNTNRVLLPDSTIPSNHAFNIYLDDVANAPIGRVKYDFLGIDGTIDRHSYSAIYDIPVDDVTAPLSLRIQNTQDYGLTEDGQYVDDLYYMVHVVTNSSNSAQTMLYKFEQSSYGSTADLEGETLTFFGGQKFNIFAATDFSGLGHGLYGFYPRQDEVVGTHEAAVTSSAELEHETYTWSQSNPDADQKHIIVYAIPINE